MTIAQILEKEGAPMAAAFLANCGLTDAQIARVAYLVGHHHTLRGIDYQILIEADYIANASENGCSRESIEIFLAKVMRTDSGRRLARAVLCGG